VGRAKKSGKRNTISKVKNHQAIKKSAKGDLKKPKAGPKGEPREVKGGVNLEGLLLPGGGP